MSHSIRSSCDCGSEFECYDRNAKLLFAVKENGSLYPLTIPSGSESGLKIKIHKELRTSLDSLLIDFDAALSVRKETDGFKLRPVIKLK